MNCGWLLDAYIDIKWPQINWKHWSDAVVSFEFVKEACSRWNTFTLIYHSKTTDCICRSDSVKDAVSCAEEDGCEARPVSWHFSKKRSTYSHSLRTNLKEAGLKCDMLTCLMSVRSDKQYSHKCSEGPTVYLPDIYPSHLIDKRISGAHPQFCFQTTADKSVGCDKTWNNPLNLRGCSHMTWMIYQTNSEVMLTVIKHTEVNALSFRGKTATFTAVSSGLHTWKEAFKKWTVF